MAVDVKVVTVNLWKFSALFAGICFRFSRRNPCISGTLLLFFFLHLFYPLVFRLLIYTSPIMICLYAYRKNVVKRELCARPLCVQLNAAFEEDKNDHDYKKSKKALKESEVDVFGKAENDLKKTSTETEIESESDILDRAAFEDEEETQEEDAQEDTRKAVEWTEQDERNLMELGTSETERDKRLESLIQKRQARKVLSMQVRNVIDIMRHHPNQIAPLVIARSTGPLNLINTLSNTDDLHMPGSAPSVLLPSRSPFDLPYDPFEERPDLTGDSSFQQEFIPADHKDFCRHESFFLGGHSCTRQDGNSLNSFMNAEKKRTERFSRFRSCLDRGSYETISTEASFLEHELMNSGETDIPDSGRELQSSKQPVKSDNVKFKNSVETEWVETEREEKCESESVNANTSGRLGTEGNIEPDLLNCGNNMSDIQVEDAKPGNLSSYLHKSLASSIQENVANEARGNGYGQAPQYTSSKDLFNVHKRAFHTPAHSIASDLVVEVSEAGSPPPTMSPPDEDYSHYDGDVERDLSSGSEDISMHVFRSDEHGTRSLEGQESIPKILELEEEVMDEYEHTSPTSSDDNSSFENVVHHLNEKLNARCLSNNVIMGTPEKQCNPTEMGSGVQIENILSHQTDPMSDASESADINELNFTIIDQKQHETSKSSETLARSTAVPPQNHTEHEPDVDLGTSGNKELDGNSSYQKSRSSEELGPLVDEQGSSDMQVTEYTDESTAIQTSDGISLAAEQQAQAVEDTSVVTSPKSVLPDTDFIDQITSLDSQPSGLADSVSEVIQLENFASSMSDNQNLLHEDIQDTRSLPSEENTQKGNTIKTKVVDKAEVSQKIENTVSKTTGADGNYVALQGDNFVEVVDSVGETNNLELSKDEKGTVSMNNQDEESWLGQSSAEALPLSNTWNSDDEFNGTSEKMREPDLEGELSTAETSHQNVYTDLTTLVDTITTSASDIGTPARNLGDTSVKSEPFLNHDSQNQAALEGMDTELQIHHITETCM